MLTCTALPTRKDLVDKVPMIKSPSFWIPKPVELPPDIHPLPEDITAYFVYPHTLEPHILSTLPQELLALQSAQSQRQHLLASIAESKERARKAQLNKIAPGWSEGGVMEPVRKDTLASSSLLPRVTRGIGENIGVKATGLTPPQLLGGVSEEGHPRAQEKGMIDLMGETTYGSPKEMGLDSIDHHERERMLELMEGLASMGQSPTRGGNTQVGDLF